MADQQRRLGSYDHEPATKPPFMYQNLEDEGLHEIWGYKLPLSKAFFVPSNGGGGWFTET